MAEIPKDKPLVSHLARKTFACTIGLANGMNIGVLSKILGHASIQVTLDSYATVVDSLMLQNVHDLKSKHTSTGNQDEKSKNEQDTGEQQCAAITYFPIGYDRKQPLIVYNSFNYFDF